MKRINPPIQIKVSIPNLPFEAWQYFEIGEPVRLEDLKKGDLFFEVIGGMDTLNIVATDPDSVNEGIEDEKEVEQMRLVNCYYSWKEASCDYEFEEGDYERLLNYLIPAGYAEVLLFPLIEKAP